MLNVYQVRPSIEDNKPDFDSWVPGNPTGEDYDATRYAREGNASTAEYFPLHFRIIHDDVQKWDFYEMGGPKLLSQRAGELLRPYLGPCLSLLPCTLNDVDWWTFRWEGSIDCLIHEESELRYFNPANRSRVMDFEKLAFDHTLLHDPQLFLVPEIARTIFATEGVKTLIEEKGLKGFRFIPVE